MSLSSVLLQAAASTNSPSSTGTNNWVLLQVVVPLATPALGLIGVMFGGKSGRSARSSRQIKQAVDIHNMLPEGSKARSAVVEHIDQLAASYIATRGYRRSGIGIGLAIVIIGLGNYFLYLAVARSGWMVLLWVPSVFLLILGTVGLSESLARKDRTDEEKQREERKGGRATSQTGENAQGLSTSHPQQPEAASGGLKG